MVFLRMTSIALALSLYILYLYMVEESSFSSNAQNDILVSDLHLSSWQYISALPECYWKIVNIYRRCCQLLFVSGVSWSHQKKVLRLSGFVEGKIQILHVNKQGWRCINIHTVSIFKGRKWKLTGRIKVGWWESSEMGELFLSRLYSGFDEKACFPFSENSNTTCWINFLQFWFWRKWVSIGVSGVRI